MRFAVRGRLLTLSYPLQYAEDVRLVFQNAQIFNPLGHWINGAAAHLSQVRTALRGCNRMRCSDEVPISSGSSAPPLVIAIKMR